MPTGKKHGKNTHKKNTGKMPTMKNAHMYNSFKIVTGMSDFVKNGAKTEGNITKTSFLNKNA